MMQALVLPSYMKYIIHIISSISNSNETEYNDGILFYTFNSQKDIRDEKPSCNEKSPHNHNHTS